VPGSGTPRGTSQTQTPGNPTGQGGGAGREIESQSAPQGGAGAGGLQKKIQDEINRRAAEHQKNLREDLRQELDKFKNHLDGKDPSAGDNPSKTGPATEEELRDTIESLKKEIAERFSDPAAKEQREALERQLETLNKLNEAIKDQSAPVQDLSGDAQKAIEEEFKKLSLKERQELEKKARELLEELEDKLREALESELQENKPESHGQRRERIENTKKAEKKDKELSKEIEEMRKEREALLGEWDRLRQGVAQQVNTLYSRLERILRPSVPDWDSGHASGQRIDPFAVMQAKADRKLVNKIWQKKTLPVDKDFVFSLLVDVSGSMSGDKALRAAECAVLMSEVLTRLKVPFEIATFDDSSEVIKQFDEAPGKEGKNEVGRGLLRSGGSTYDFSAIHERVRGIVERPEENKFLIVVTDGGSNDPAKLTKELDAALRGNIRVIGLGIGSETSDVDKYYPIGRGKLSIDPKDNENALGPYFSKVLAKILTNPEQFVREALKKRGGQNGSNNDQ
jgi:uncharacterized protein with von Willebrand factor type A (vWA) domain